MRSIQSRTYLYILIVLLLIFITVSIKVVSTLIGEQFLYEIIIIGDIFKSLEIVELVNVLAFAILGMGFGLASAFLPQMARHKTSAVLLIVLVPLIFCSSAMLKYNIWIEDVADKEKISFLQAESLTSSFLNHRVGLNGFLGFYVYTAQFPLLPTNQDEIKKADKLEKKVKADFLSITKIVKIKPEIVTWFLTNSRWLIRFFYFSLAVTSTITHFHIGCQELIKSAKPTVPYFPPVPPRFKGRSNNRSNKPTSPAHPAKSTASKATSATRKATPPASKVMPQRQRKLPIK